MSSSLGKGEKRERKIMGKRKRKVKDRVQDRNVDRKSLNLAAAPFPMLL
jgi:hypothetical protein